MSFQTNPRHPLVGIFCRLCIIALVLFCSMATLLCRTSQLFAQDAAPAATDAENQDDEPRVDGFVRVAVNRNGDPVSMDTAVVRYEGRNDKGARVIVDLIGVVHIGEREYYEQLNRSFTRYDAVLYELVAPEGTVIPKGGRKKVGGNPIAALQKGMQQTLGLEFQLDHIDYTAENFVHADMSPEEFAESMKQNEESVFKMAFRAMGQSIARQGTQGRKDPSLDIIRAAISGDQFAIRQAAAEQINDLESGMLIFEGKDGSTIIHHRNKKALSVLKREIDGGKNHVAVFYGAGHLPDMEQRLLNDFNMQRGGTSWLRAWKLQDDNPKNQSKQP